MNEYDEGQTTQYSTVLCSWHVRVPIQMKYLKYEVVQLTELQLIHIQYTVVKYTAMDSTNTKVLHSIWQM